MSDSNLDFGGMVFVRGSIRRLASYPAEWHDASSNTNEKGWSSAFTMRTTSRASWPVDATKTGVTNVPEIQIRRERETGGRCTIHRSFFAMSGIKCILGEFSPPFFPIILKRQNTWYQFNEQWVSGGSLSWRNVKYYFENVQVWLFLGGVWLFCDNRTWNLPMSRLLKLRWERSMVTLGSAHWPTIRNGTEMLCSGITNRQNDSTKPTVDEANSNPT